MKIAPPANLPQKKESIVRISLQVFIIEKTPKIITATPKNFKTLNLTIT